MTEEQSPHKLSIDPLSPKILNFIQENFLDRVIRGEQYNKLLIFLVCCSAFTKKALAAVVKGRSSAGKSTLVNKVLDIFREMGIVMEFSRITNAFLENMPKHDLPSRPVKPRKKDFESEVEYGKVFSHYTDLMKEYAEELEKPRIINLTGRILYIDELKGMQNSQAVKLSISEGRLRLGTVINGEPMIIEVIGTPAIITTTTLAALGDPELENRIIPIQIDESEEQTREVLRHQALGYLNPAQDFAKDRALEAIIEYLNKLKPYDVANPYADRLASVFPTKNIEARRDYPKVMNLVNVVAWLFQYQRRRAKIGVDLFLVARQEDIETAKALGLASLRESLSGISEAEQKILDWLKEQKTEAGEYAWVTISEALGPLQKVARKREQWVRDHFDRLASDGYAEKEEIPQKHNRYHYRYGELQAERLDLPEEAYTYDPSVEETWANTFGFKLLDPPGVGNTTILSEAQTVPLEPSKPVNSPKSDFGQPSEQAVMIGHEQTSNPNVVLPTQSVSEKTAKVPITFLSTKGVRIWKCQGCQKEFGHFPAFNAHIHD